MNEHDQDDGLFEAELRQLQPAKLPEDFAARLDAARSGTVAGRSDQPAPVSPAVSWWDRLRWLIPATAAACLAGALLVVRVHHAGKPGPVSTTAAPPALLADDVEIDRQLISSFEAVATLPGGEPVRVQCREWMDEIVLRDTAHGVSIEQRSPRYEIVPVRFETF